MNNYMTSSSKTPSVFSASDIFDDVDEQDRPESGLFSHSSTNNDYNYINIHTPQRRTSSMSNEQAKAIIFSAYNENKKNSHNHQLSQADHHHYELHAIPSQSAYSDPRSSANPPSTTPRLYHIRLSTDDDTFKTIMKKDENTTVGEIIEILQKKFKLGDHILISLEDGDNVAKHLTNNEKIVQLQNRLLKMNGVDDDDLPSACLKNDVSFKFLIHR